MSKKLRYKRVRDDETIDISLVFGQAAALLDLAAKHSIIHNDANLMLEVADRWIQVGSLLAQDDDSKEYVDTNSKSVFGFGPTEEGVDDDE
jgi:hypothetical protein